MNAGNTGTSRPARPATGIMEQASGHSPNRRLGRQSYFPQWGDQHQQPPCHPSSCEAPTSHEVSEIIPPLMDSLFVGVPESHLSIPGVNFQRTGV